MSKVLHLPPVEAHALWAASYDKTPNPILKLEERHARAALPWVDGKDVLDVACGTGRWLARLLHRGAASAVGLDLSAEMLEQARTKLGDAALLVRADAMEVPLRTASIDFSMCSFGLSYMQDIRRFAKEISRVVRDRGYLLLTDFHPSAEARGWKRRFRHDGVIVEVVSVNRSVEETQETFVEEGLELQVCLEPAFGKEERSIFEECGRAAVFEELVGQAAIVVLLFRKNGNPSSGPTGHLLQAVASQNKCDLEACNRPPEPGGQRGPIGSRERRFTRKPPKHVALEPPLGYSHDFLCKTHTSTWLLNGRIALDAETSISANLEISDGKIRRVTDEASRDADTIDAIDLRNYLLLPGLINSHDHLEFNLFPRLGHGPYSNSSDWARDIYHPERSPVREHLSVPKTVRLMWGGVKSLLSGVTTVCHHNPWDVVFEREFPVQVVRRYGWAHSITFAKDVYRTFAATEPDRPFMIHAGEGTDPRSEDEVFELDRIGALDSRTVLIHGVGFSEAGHTLLNRRGASLVWCPTSNRFVLGATLTPHSVATARRVALGSDSALTARGNLIDEIHAAREEGASPHAIYRMVTEAAAWILLLKEGEGTLRPHAVANIIAIPWTGGTPAEALMQMEASQVEMVLISGRLHLASGRLLGHFPVPEQIGLETITVDGLRRWVRAPIQWLMSETTPHLGDQVCLAGMTVAV